MVIGHGEKKISSSSKLAILLMYPFAVQPLGLFLKHTLKAITDHFTPYEFKRAIQEQPWRSQNYLFNKRFMFIDLFYNQFFFQNFSALFMILFLNLSEQKIAQNRGKQWGEGDLVVNHKPDQHGWQYLVKVRWALIVARISSEYGHGLAAHYGKSSQKSSKMCIALFNLIWQANVIGTVLNSGLSDPKTPNSRYKRTVKSLSELGH